MKLTLAIKSLLALRCFESPKQTNLYEPPPHGAIGSISDNWVVTNEPKRLRSAADAIEWNERREKECPKAKKDFEAAMKEEKWK